MSKKNHKICGLLIILCDYFGVDNKKIAIWINIPDFWKKCRKFVYKKEILLYMQKQI